MWMSIIDGRNSLFSFCCQLKKRITTKDHFEQKFNPTFENPGAQFKMNVYWIEAFSVVDMR